MTVTKTKHSAHRRSAAPNSLDQAVQIRKSKGLTPFARGRSVGGATGFKLAADFGVHQPSSGPKATTKLSYATAPIDANVRQNLVEHHLPQTTYGALPDASMRTCAVPGRHLRAQHTTKLGAGNRRLIQARQIIGVPNQVSTFLTIVPYAKVPSNTSNCFI